MSPQIKALWVWPNEHLDLRLGEVISSMEGRSRLVLDAAQSGVTDLYVSVFKSVVHQPSAEVWGTEVCLAETDYLYDSKYMMYEFPAIWDLIELASRHKIRVWAAYGANGWLEPPNQPWVSDRMKDVIAYNGYTSSGKVNPFNGVMLDVETSDDLAGLLGLCTQILAIFKSEGSAMKLGAATRAFWSQGDFAQILDKDLDQVVVMAYRDTAGSGVGDNGVIDLAYDEIHCANTKTINNKTQGDRVVIGLETAGFDCLRAACPSSSNGHSNVYVRIPPSQTFYSAGLTALDQAMLAVKLYFDTRSLPFGGFAIHHYLQSYLAGWPALPEPVHITFDDLANGSAYHAGDYIVSCHRGMQVKHSVYLPTATPVITVQPAGMAGGHGFELSLQKAGLHFDLGEVPAIRANLFFRMTGYAEIIVNGVPEVFLNTPGLPTSPVHQIGLVNVYATTDDPHQGRLELDGRITDLTIGGKGLYIDDVWFYFH